VVVPQTAVGSSQQSAADWQGPPSTAQPQTPLIQKFEQQSWLPPHAVRPTGTQHRSPLGPPPQTAPLQQEVVEPLPQAAAGCPHPELDPELELDVVPLLELLLVPEEAPEEVPEEMDDELPLLELLVPADLPVPLLLPLPGFPDELLVVPTPLLPAVPDELEWVAVPDELPPPSLDLLPLDPEEEALPELPLELLLALPVESPLELVEPLELPSPASSETHRPSSQAWPSGQPPSTQRT
jgi:hypothetical protein